MKNAFDLMEVGASSTARTGASFRRPRTRALHQVVPVNCDPWLPDLHPGVPDRAQVHLSGIPYTVPDQAVCTECKRNETSASSTAA
jgi:hypothetical protein